jgi:hypothetical protein
MRMDPIVGVAIASISAKSRASEDGFDLETAGLSWDFH